MKILYLMLFSMTMLTHPIKIVPLSAEHIQTVRRIIFDCIIEFSLLPHDSVQDIERKIIEADKCNDPLYHHPYGIFLVVVEHNTIIGMGAIKRLDEITCELKRMFFSPEGRHKGYGTLLLTTLLEHAKTMGYRKIRLEVYNPNTQKNAINFYKKYGFHEIKPYKTEHYSMEKTLK